MSPERPAPAQSPKDREGPRRHHRRVDAPATDGIPESARTDAGDPKLDGAEGGGVADRGADPADEHGSEQWWRGQRPPHWE